MRLGKSITMLGSTAPVALVSLVLLSLLMLLTLVPVAHAAPVGKTICPNNTGGILMPPGATFTDSYGNTWVAPSGFEGSGGIFDQYSNMTSYFFPGPITSVPPPMWSGSGGVFGTYNGQQGWIITDYCQIIIAV